MSCKQGVIVILRPQNRMAAFLPRIIQLGSLEGGVQPVSRDFQPVWGENPFVIFLISPKPTEILYPPLVKFSGKSCHSNTPTAHSPQHSPAVLLVNMYPLYSVHRGGVRSGLYVEMLHRCRRFHVSCISDFRPISCHLCVHFRAKYTTFEHN